MPRPRPTVALGLTAALIAALSAGQAQAQTAPGADGPVTTASGPGSPPITPPTAVQTTAVQTNGPAGADSASDSDAVPDDRKPHGYIDVGVGNRGYRRVEGAITVPIGEDGQATVAIGDVQGDGWKQ